MHFTQLFTITVCLAAGAFAVPNNPPPPPTKPSQPPQPTQTVVNQQNNCGNNVTPYCCTSDGKLSYTSCYAMGASSQCSNTVVCCNAQESIQVCIGNANVAVN